MTFSIDEISTMLVDYEKDYNIGMNIKGISEKIYQFSNGYPFLVSKICKIIDEKLNKNWTNEGVDNAVKLILKDKNTLFDDLIKNLENDKEMYNFIFAIVFGNEQFSFETDSPLIDKSKMFSIVREENSKVVIHNKIFEIKIYNYLISKMEIEKKSVQIYASTSQFIDELGDLKMDKIIDRFQVLMMEEYRVGYQEFLEKEGRLIFLVFIKPIINGEGFYFIESEIRNNMRLDVVVTFNKKQYIIELKKWYGRDREEESHYQLINYLESKQENTGYLVVFDFRKRDKEYNEIQRRYN